MQNTNQQNDGLNADEREVFALLAQARSQYEEYLKAQEACGDLSYRVPAAEDYNWDKPLTVVLCH